MKKFLSLLLAFIMLFGLTSCMKASPKDFTYEDMTITLTNRFKKTNDEGHNVCYESSDMMVIVMKGSISVQSGTGWSLNLTLDEYANLVRQTYASKSPSEITKHENFQSMEYTFLNEQENQTYTYFTTIFQGTDNDTFWMIQFASKEEDYASHKDTFLEFANSVKFAQ